MASINFTVANPIEEYTIQFTGTILQVKLFCRKQHSHWFYIPRIIIRALNLQAGTPAYFYTVDDTTLVLSFRDPHLHKARARKICYAGSKDDLTITIPSTLIDKEILNKTKQIQFINPTGITSHEWQLRLL